MSKQIRAAALLLAAALALSGCNARSAPAGEQAAQESALSAASEASAAPASNAGSADAGQDEQVEAQQDAGEDYIDGLVQQTIAAFYQPGMSEYEMAKAAFDYMIETASLVDPIGLDLWRIRGNYAEPPSFVENRSLSVLQFGIGKCEDYAAALTMLLRGMGLEAEYVPGLTYSTQGALVDHAWTVVRVDGIWYHLDCQLEQNISRHGSIRYKYFMRSDATMVGSHRWGQNLIDSGLLSAEQNEEIARDYTPSACPQDYPTTPERHSFDFPQTPDLSAILSAVEEEFLAYEREHGPLEPLEINTVPPVFALEGYGPQD